MKHLIATFLFLTIAAACVEGRCTETLQYGSTGDCVKVVQRAVGVTDDGIFGPNTRSAVIVFQHDHGLALDGIVGPNTWRVIYGG